MYHAKDYFNRGTTFINNQVFPSRKKLSTLMIYATDLCDSGCKHCQIWQKRPVKYLSFDKITEVMQSNCITQNTSVGLEGGEFMLHPEALKILEWFHTHHKNFDLLSNCLKADKLIDAVKKFPPRRLYVSLDGTEDTYLYMRGKPGYNSVLKVIKNLKDVLPVSVMFTLSPYNDFTDLQHVAEVCKKHGVDLRVGIYNNIAFFDTIDKAHKTQIGSRKDAAFSSGYDEVKTFKTNNKRMAKSCGTVPDELVEELPMPQYTFAEKIENFIERFRQL